MTKTAQVNGEKRKFFFRAASFSLFSLFFSASLLYADLRKWEFDNAEDYQFEQNKIELKDGSAKLSSVAPYRDAGSESFKNGEFTLYTTAERGTLELAFPPVQETPGPELPSPVGNREPGLSALWHFDEPSGTNVLDVAGRTIAKGSDVEIVSGQTGFGFARLFDGEKSFVFIPHYETLRLDGPFTLEMWIRPVEVIRAKPQTLISRWQTVGAQRGFALQISPAGKINFLVSPEGSTTVEQTGESILSGGIWHHVAAVYNGQDLRIYVNGILDGRPLPFSGPVYTSNNPVYLGALVDNRVDQFYKGVIDEAAIYNRSLSETEILAHYGNLQGLAGLWHFNERGGVLADQSGYGQNGTVLGEANGVRYEAEGKIGTALAFNEKPSYVEMPASTRFAPSGQMHLEAWIKPERLPGLGQTSTVVSIYEEGASKGSTGSEFSMALTGPDGRIMAYAPKLQPAQTQGRMALMPGVWQHVAVSWGQGKVRIYNNGLLDTEASYSGSLDFSKTALRVGNDSKTVSQFYGLIDEVAVYRRPRTEQEISWTAGIFMPGGIYTSEVKDSKSISPWKSFYWKLPLEYGRETDGRQTGLLHAYHLNDIEGSSITNSTGEILGSPIGTYPVPGIFGQARWFAAKGYDKILSQKDFPALSTFTVSAWFQFASAQPGLSDRIFSIGDGNPTVLRASDGKIHVQMPGAREIVGQRSLGDAGWHHLALTADGQTLFLYIDGLLDGNSPLMTATAPQPLVLGNLKSSDTFQGAIDEFLLYNYPLDRDGVMQQFLRGKMDVKMLARSSDDAHFANSQWRGPQGVRWAEDAGAYTSGLWHFEEIIYKGEPGEVRDSGRFAGHGSVFGKALRYPSAVYGSGLDLNGATDFVRAPDSQGLHMERFTLSAWVRPEQTAQGTVTILDKQFRGGAPVFSSFALELLEGSRLAARAGRPGGYLQVESGRDGEVAAGRWNLVAATFDGKEIRLYINGKFVKAADFHETIPYDDGPLYFGRYGASETRFFAGQLDEIHFQNTAATEQEIKSRFLLGDGANFFRPFEPVSPGVSPARYFQYQIQLNSQVPFASPAVSEINLLSNPFPPDKPAVTILNGISYAELSRFSERLGKNNSGNVTYQLSPDGANWFFTNGRHWIVAAGASESNTARQIQDRIHDFAKEVGIGSFYFRAFLNSPTGSEPVELDSVEVEFLPNKLTVTAPNGGEALLTGADQIIRWNSAGEVSKVDIEYSKDDFKKDFHLIAKGVPNEGSYAWKVPDDLSVQVKVRVLDALNPKIYDVSDLPFRITGKLELLTPNWNERWEVGSVQNISWKTLGSIQNVKLEYSTDDFTKNIFPIVDSLKNEGSYKWTVPDHVSKNVKVRVSDLRDLQVFDGSNDTFAVMGRITVSNPDLSSRWLVGSTQEIRWQTTGTLPLVHIDYQTSKSPEWVRIAENFHNTGTYMWKVPDNIDGQTQIRLTDAADSKVAGDSAAFSITGGLRLLNPVGGEEWTAGTRRKIAWQTIGTMPTVDIEYKANLDEKWQTLEKALANTGEYVWEVPASIMGPVTIRVLDAHDSTVQAMHSPSNIIPGFHLRAPDGGENWKIGTEQNITWETTGDAPAVRIEYSKDNFKSDIHEIISSASNLGSFTWMIPDDASPETWVRVSDSSNSTAQTSSKAPFRIYGGFEIQIPKGGEKFEVGTLATFLWQTTGRVPTVRIEYSHDGFHKDARLIEAELPNEGKYTWKVPDDLGDGYQIRLRDARDEKTETYSEGSFSVIGNFHLTYPAGGEDLIAGTLSKINWRGFGSAPIVRIDYSEDDFQKSFNTIADKAPNTGSYEWTIPNLIGRKFKLRIWDPSQPDSMDTMQVPARIVGGFRLLEPNGGELLHVGDRIPVKWETSGTLPRVKLEFSPDNFTKEASVIADSYPNNGMYEWLVPNAPSAKYRIRISDPHDVTAFDISNSDFTIRSHFSLLSPNGGEGWPVGSRQMIRWQTTASVSRVKLEYTTNDFAAAKIIEQAAPNTGEYEWTVPDDAAYEVRIRVSDVDDREAMDTSDSPLRIQGVLNLTSPAGKETWKIGEQRAITWQTTGKIEGVRLEYSRDGFSSDAKTIIDSMPNTGFYNWIVPDDLTTLAKVRVMDVKDNQVQSVSPQPFEMIGGFVLLGPNGGEVWHATEKREINWMTVGSVKDVTVYYSSDDFKKDVQIIERGIMNTGRLEWEIPSALGDHYKVRICDADNANACDTSDNVFAVRSPLEFTYPKGGEKWAVGSNQELRWNSYGSVPKVSIFYTPRLGEWIKMIEELPNEGHFLFRTPDNISNDVFFKVSNDENAGLEDITREPVSILGTFDLISPNGGEKWASGTTQKITWDTLGTVSNARLEYSIDDFENDVNLIESSYTNTGSYLWTVPEKTGITMKVRISDADHTEAFDVSNNIFKIMPGVTVAAPNGGEKWTAGHTEKIVWKTAGKADWVRLEYKTGSDLKPAVPVAFIGPMPQEAAGSEPEAGWTLIAERVPNGGEYDWKLPEQNGREFLVRVTDALDPDAGDVSDRFFEIKPELTLTLPVGGEHFKIGSDAEIIWNTVGTAAEVRIEYSTDGFLKDIRTVAEKISNTGKFLWQVPDFITTDARIRVTSVEDASVFTVSPKPFKILPVFEILVPTGLEQWTVGTDQEIKWNWHGSLETVKLEYSLNDFSSASVIQSAAPNKGSFIWQIPDLAHSLVRVRVSDPMHAESLAISQPFKVIPGFKVTVPNGGEKFKAGERRHLEWETSGSSSKIRLEYGILNADVWTWKPIENVLRNQNKFEWRVPEEVSGAVKIRVTDAVESAASDESGQPFKIIGVFKILGPHADEILKVEDRYEIRWETAGKVPAVKIEYSFNPSLAGSFKPVENSWNNSGKYFWTVPDAVSEKVWVRVSDAAEPEAAAVSDSFKIRPVLKWDMPVQAGGFTNQFIWAIDSVQTLKWNTRGTISKVNIEYTIDQKNWKPVAMGIANAGNYGWKIPDDTAQGVKLRVSDASLPIVFDTTETPVTIAAQFEILSPRAGEILIVGNRQPVTWKTTGRVQKVWLEFMTDGKKWQAMSGPMPDQGSFEWTVPDKISSEVKVRIFDGNNAVAQAISSPFQIKGVLNLVSPQGAEVWETGSRHTINWQTTGSIPHVKIEAVEDALNEGMPIKKFVIADHFQNKGSFEWTVPDQISNQFKIVVSDARDSDVATRSANPFSIIAHFAVKTPKAEDVWIVGSGHEIVWNTSGTVPEVALEFSRDDFYRDVNLIASPVPNTGAALWTVPDAISSSMKIRVSDVRDSRAAAVSGNFTIRGAMNFTQPEAGTVWSVGSRQTIAWETLGTIASVRLEYSRDDFRRDVQIIENVKENKNGFEWTLPDVISSTLKLRVTDENDTAVFAVSNPVKVRGVLNLKFPLGGEKFQVLSTQKIAWQTTGSISRVRLEYSKDDFTQDVHVLAADLKNQGSFDWVIPDDISHNVKIRVLDAQDFSVSSASPQAFSIRGSFLLTTSTEGARWAVGSPQAITWETVGTIPQVRLEYSKDDFQTDVRPVAESVLNTGSFIWKIPDDISNSVRLRVIDAGNEEVLTATADPAAIVGMLTWPLSKEKSAWTVGDQVVLKWNSEGTIPLVQLEYAEGSGAGTGEWKFISGSLENTGEFTWTVPDFIRENVVLRVSDVRDLLTSHISQPASIMGRLQMAVPGAGERWIVGTPHEVIWNTTGTIPSVILEYSTDEFRRDVRPAAADAVPNTGRLTVALPDVISNSLQIRVKDARYHDVASASPFFSSTGDLSFTSPAGPAVWQIGQTEKIKWQSVGTIPYIKLEYFPDISSAAPPAAFGPFLPGQEPADANLSAAESVQGVVIAPRIANIGSFEWQIPENALENLRLRVSNADDNAVSAETREPIRVLGVLNLTSPAENQTWKVGSVQEILWKTTGSIPNVKLEFSTDDFTEDVRPIAVTSNAGSHKWTVPDYISSRGMIRVSDAQDARAFSISAPFKIQGDLQFENFDPAQILTVDSTHKIQWRTFGSIPRVRLEFSRDNFNQDVQLAADEIENNGFFEWKTADAISDKLRFRISNPSDPAVYAVSDPVKVVGALKLLTPATMKKFPVQTIQKIVWETTGSIEKVRLEYSRDDFDKDVRPISGQILNEGIFSWTIPDDIGDGFKIRILDASNPRVFSISPSAFSIRGVLFMTVSSGAERWIAGSKQEMTWATVGTIPSVTIQYSKDDFQKDVHLVAENIPNHGIFSWVIPDDISNTVRVRVFDSAYAEVISVSEPHAITGALEWLPFTGGAVFQVNDSRKIQWKTEGTIPVVRLEYTVAGDVFPLKVPEPQSRTGAVTVAGDAFPLKVPEPQSRIGAVEEALPKPIEEQDWKLITGSLENKGEFSWSIPDFIHDQIVLRISDARDFQTKSVSQPFKIQGRLTALQPAGGERWVVGSSQDLVWATSGSIFDVILEYSADAFKKDIHAITAEPIANSGRFKWVVPDSIAERIQTRVRDARNAEVSGVSGVFSISGKLSFVNPSGAAAWQMGAPQMIEWRSLGTIPFVRLEYMSADVPEGQERGFIIASRLENKGKFEWNIPSDAPAKIKLRIINAEDSTVFDETPESVRIFGILSMTAPSGPQNWIVGSRQDIAWTTQGAVPNVKLEYSRDRFVKDVQTIYPLIPNTGSVSWQVPDAISREVWLRVSDADNPTVSAVSAAPVSVKGAFQIVSPQDAQPVQVSEKQEIVWQTMGSIPLVNLEYSEDLFSGSRVTIAENISNTGHYFWDIPDAAHKKISVRVVDASDTEVYGVSRPFNVHGGVSLVSPRGGEIWKVDDSALIRWQTLGQIPFVKLEHSSDEFVTSGVIAARADNKGIFVWHVPPSINKPVKIRVYDAEDPEVFSTTQTAVKVQGVLGILAPQGGEFWLAGSEQPVIWQTRGGMPYVNVEYSVDNFNTAVPVVMGMANQGRLNFTVPDLAAESLQFRISDSRDQSVMAVSRPLRVGGRIVLLAPGGNDVLKVGSDEAIQWKTTGTIPKIKIEFSGDGFKNDVRLIQEAADNSGVYTWRVPDAISKDLQLRVSDFAHADIYDVTAAPFKISGEIKITAPIAGESWAVSSRKSLEWETKGTIPFVRIEYSKDNFFTAIPVDLRARNTGKMEWSVPDFSGEQIQFRVSDASDSSVSDATPFSIAVHGVLSLSSPLGGEVWTAKTEHPISWNTIGTIPNVTLSYMAGASDQPVKIAEAIANTGSMIWNLPDKGMAAVKVRVADSKNPFIYSESPVFEVQGTLALTAPQGGEIWLVGSQHPIMWNSAGSIEKVRLEYTSDNFNTVAPVALSLPNEGKFLWRVPDAVSRSVRIRLSDAAFPSIVSESGNFEIRGALALINPLGGEDWAVGSRHPISWQTTGTIPQIRLEYSTDDFQSDVQLIAPALVNKGVFYWDVPSLNTQQLKIRVMDTANPDVFDMTRNSVRIAGALALTVPNQGESYRVGEKMQIRWTGTPNVANVKLEYSLDDFRSVTLISNYVPNSGKFDWNVPDRISDNVKIRISDSANSIVAAASQIPFKIQGSFRFVSPKGGEIWNVGSRQVLSWETLGSIPKVRLEYSSDRFKTAVPIAAGLDNQGRFDWAVPDLEENGIEFRVSDASAPSVQAVTGGRIEIVSSLDIISPAGGERWIVGDEKIIRWRTLGGMSKVNLEYSKDNFNKDIQLIAADVTNFGSHSWKIPHDLGKEVRLRVKGAADSKIAAISQAFAVDLNRVTWSIRDLRTNEHLIGLTLTDSTGKTQKNLSSPLMLEYPYGIYTTVWSKPGYAEFQSTWLADKDLNFTLTMTPEEKTAHAVRFDFRYDGARDLMSIKSWYEQDGLPLSAVIQSEVRIYQGTELIKTLISSTPDTEGYFNMVWDTRQVAGNARYTASTTITTASGQVHAGPVSYQLDIPVKEVKEPVVRQSVSSIYLKPIGTSPVKPTASASVLQLLAPSALNSGQAAAPAAPLPKQKAPEPLKTEQTEEVQTKPESVSTPFISRGEMTLSAPDEAILNETVSIHFSGVETSRPVLDLYDANRRLTLSAEPMKAEGQGKFNYLLSVKGASFIPGKPVTATVVDLSSGEFKSVSIMIKSATSALGLDRQAGMISAQELLAELDLLVSGVQEFQKGRQPWDTALQQLDDGLSKLAGSLIQSNLPPVVLEKINDLSRAMANLLGSKGYESNFLLKGPLKTGASASTVDAQFQLIKEASNMLRRLYQATAG